MTLNKKISLGAAIAFMVVVAGITFCITMMVALGHFNTMVLNVKEREEQYKKLANVDSEVRQNYAGAIDDEALYDAIAAGYIRVLDKYSSYLTKAQYEELLAEQNGQRVSIGISTERDATGYLVVTKVIPGSPAAQDGLQAGDILIAVDGRDLQNLTLSAGQRLLKGEPGTKVSVTWRRDGVDTTLDFTRKDIEIPTVEARMIGTNGYLLISDITDKTAEQFRRAVDEMIQKGAQGLIFDVRGNTSSSITAANKMLDVLLPSGELGLLMDNEGVKKSSGYSDKYSVNLPMSVLVNGKTGCAAEYFAGVLQSYKQRGSADVSVVGVTTLGKSSLQEIRPLKDGSALNLTTSYFLLPGGGNGAEDVNIDGAGIKPDYEVKLTAEQEQAFATLNEENDPQLKKAIEIVNSKQTVPTTPVTPVTPPASSGEGGASSGEGAAAESSSGETSSGEAE